MLSSDLGVPDRISAQLHGLPGCVAGEIGCEIDVGMLSIVVTCYAMRRGVP
jgi:hypothetical protein